MSYLGGTAPGWTQSACGPADDPSSDKLLMVMEFAEGGHVMLSDSSSPNDVYALSEGVARKYFRDVIKVGPWHPEATRLEAGLVTLVGAPIQ